MKKSYSVLMLFAAAVLPAFASVQDTLVNTIKIKTATSPQTVVDDDPEDFPVIPISIPVHDSVLSIRIVPKDTVIDVPDTDYLLLFIQDYDINKHQVHPRAARVFKPNEILDYPRMLSLIHISE